MSWLAELILIVHVAFVAFVVGGLVFIWIGAWRGWQAVGNFPFRVTHLAAVLFVVAESLIGIACPLTIWEDRLRDRATDANFIARWLRRALYYDFSETVFAAAYLLFAALVAVSFLLSPPRRSFRQK